MNTQDKDALRLDMAPQLEDAARLMETAAELTSPHLRDELLKYAEALLATVKGHLVLIRAQNKPQSS